ncbi:hypothetical protein [Bacteroides pyogenes]|uniref:hypothetical protein n=1 Tax=Bacteroides pyogenes TaxID=310300 RepID=UPI002A910575|nr:hypothetical protein [Bacteroides pyogenes]MDY5433173.1 hypothetical protein [Bacteroides pyogenes]
MHEENIAGNNDLTFKEKNNKKSPPPLKKSPRALKKRRRALKSNTAGFEKKAAGFFTDLFIFPTTSSSRAVFMVRDGECPNHKTAEWLSKSLFDFLIE